MIGLNPGIIFTKAVAPFFLFRQHFRLINASLFYQRTQTIKLLGGRLNIRLRINNSLTESW